MKRKMNADGWVTNLLLTVIATACAVGFGAGQALAANGTWSATPTDTDWANAANWVSGVVPGDTNGLSSTNADTATFNNSSGLTVDPDADRVIHYLTFGSSAGDYTIGGSHTLYIYGGRTTGNNTATITFAAPIRFLFDNYVGPATGQTFDFNGTITANAGRSLLFNTNGTVNVNSEVFSSSGSPTAGNPVNFRFLSNSPTVNFNHANTDKVNITFDAAANGTANLNVANVVVSNGGGHAGINIGGGGHVYVNAANAINGSSAYVNVGSGYNSFRYSFMEIKAGQNYEGDTVIGQASNPVGKTADRSVLLVNNTIGSGTGNSDITVNTGILGGTGFITNTDSKGVTVAAGGVLSPGVSESAGNVGTLTFDLGSKGLDISGAVSANASQSLLFDLDTPGHSDKIAMLGSSALNIGSGTLNFDDFVFSPATGLLNGVYTLFDSNETIAGTLGSSLTGAIGTDGAAGLLSLGDNGHDIVLTVTGAAVPEPASLALLALGGLVLLPRRQLTRA